MTRSILILVIMILLAACNNQNRPKKDAKIIGQSPMWDFDCDSILKLQNVNELTDSISKINFKKQIFIDIKLSCDSILTSEQIELIRLKQIENRKKMIK